MPRVTERIARKDYPNSGIVKGDKYYYWKIKMARGGIVCRSKTYPRPSQLNRGFRGQIGDIEQDLGNADSPEALREIAEGIRELGEEAQDSFDNMPEGLQQGDTGQLLEERAQGCESWAEEIESIADNLEQELEALEALIEEWDQYDTACSAYEELTEEEQEDEDEPVEPDEERPEDEARSNLISEKIEEAQNANPGL